ncbi:hypothetical protein NHX12_009073 [Muraenolepis orangiensis]|uniref:Uncharacterized protein n=1 Tax=Muraenolepis orangiensis TaxID=630683 RepID=A0A9Q0DMP0_9TELE|nr:hypothetical protein NHX12_009073 [Muraenolepis orangiensis]
MSFDRSSRQRQTRRGPRRAPTTRSSPVPESTHHSVQSRPVPESTHSVPPRTGEHPPLGPAPYRRAPTRSRPVPESTHSFPSRTGEHPPLDPVPYRRAPILTRLGTTGQ